MGNLFAKHTGAKITDSDRAVLTLKTQRRKLTVERKRIEGVIEREVKVAKELIAQKKRERALLALKKKKLQEAQLDKLDAWLLNVEQMLANVESAARQSKLFSAMKQGHAALKELQKEVTVEDVEQLMEDTAEAKEYEDRVRQLLGESLSADEDAAALAELDAMEAEFLKAEIEEEMPAAPTHEVEAPIVEAAAQQEGVEALADPVEQLRQAANQREGRVLAVEEPIPA
ncbi:hypothetical protein WJX72_001804 [[Myrmecia] bisecta]|uniref:Uncharacterized protein n=1 Tax=[Myrmecia] bisecta TaxID=41462 RepID=A0AAW1PXA0_9CHLO